MTTEAKPTRGRYVAIPQHVVEGPDEVRAPEGWLVCTTSAFDHAALIAEAFNVYTETDMTPRQLAERVKELEGALVEIKNMKSEPIGDTGFVTGPALLFANCQRRARAALLSYPPPERRARR